MGAGDFGFSALASLRTVESWIGVINSNLNASSRTGFKASKVKFRGGVSEIVRTPNGPVLGIQNPETTLQIDQTSIDFSQGSIIESTEPTHLAIQGKGFFTLSTGMALPFGSVAAAGPTGDFGQYYSRDGEFHVVNTGVALATGENRLILVHSTGLYLVDGTTGQAAILDVANGLVRVDDGSATLGAMAVMDETDLLNTLTPNFLRYSRFGSTVFEANQDSEMVQMNPGESRVIAQTLESSNSSLSASLPELSLAQKFFSAITKVISVHQTNLDTVINLVR